MFPMRRLQILMVGMLAMCASAAPAQDVVQANWREIKVEFPFNGRGTQYHCHRVERKVTEILQVVGANPKTSVRVSGCQFERPSMNIVFTIHTAVPVLAPPRPVAKAPLEATVAKQWGPQPFEAT